MNKSKKHIYHDKYKDLFNYAQKNPKVFQLAHFEITTRYIKKRMDRKYYKKYLNGYFYRKILNEKFIIKLH